MLLEVSSQGRTVHSYVLADMWANCPRECASWSRQYKNQVSMARKKQRRNAHSKPLIVDAQNVKTRDTADQKVDGRSQEGFKNQASSAC